MERGKKIDWPGAVMGRDRKMMRVGERGDLDRLGQTAGPNQIDHGDVGGLFLKNFEKGRLCNQSLADALRDAGFVNKALQIRGAGWLHDVFHPDDVVRFQRARDPDRAVQVPTRMAFDRNFHFVADRFADFLYGPESLFQLLRRNRMSHRSHR